MSSFFGPLVTLLAVSLFLLCLPGFFPAIQASCHCLNAKSALTGCWVWRWVWLVDGLSVLVGNLLRPHVAFWGSWNGLSHSPLLESIFLVVQNDCRERGSWIERYSCYLDCCQNDSLEFQEVFFSHRAHWDLSLNASLISLKLVWLSVRFGLASLPDRQIFFNSVSLCTPQQVKPTFKHKYAKRHLAC